MVRTKVDMLCKFDAQAAVMLLRPEHRPHDNLSPSGQGPRLKNAKPQLLTGFES
jgi:hypothetical protein